MHLPHVRCGDYVNYITLKYSGRNIFKAVVYASSVDHNEDINIKGC